MTNQEPQSEIARLQGYMDNAAETIRKLQEENDRWRAAVTDLCAFANVTVAQIMEAGLRVHIETED